MYISSIACIFLKFRFRFKAKLGFKCDLGFLHVLAIYIIKLAQICCNIYLIVCRFTLFLHYILKNVARI